MTTRIRLLGWLYLTLLVSSGGGLQSAENPRVAAIDFILGESAASRDPRVADFSRDVQTRLLLRTEYAWIERQELERFEREIDLAGQARISPTSAVRLGHWLHADLLLRGEINRPAAGKAELGIEVLDLKRAEVLATSRTSVAVDSRNLVRPEPADVERAVAGALGALREARTAWEQNARRRVIAPLFFRNAGRTERLNFVETRLHDAIAKAAEGAGSVRLLRFPRSREAIGESELVVAGLTDTNPDAWQHVADVYVWGTFSEKESENLEFADVPVVVASQVWRGSGEPREVKWEGRVRDLEQGLQHISAALIAVAADTAVAPVRTGADSQRLAAQVATRAQEVSAEIQRGRATAGPDTAASFLSSPTGRNLLAYQLRLLEIACFFNPLDRRLQDLRLRASGAPENPLAPADPLQRLWRQIADYQANIRRFEQDDSRPAALVLNERATLIEMLESIRYLLALPAHTQERDGIRIAPAEADRQSRAATLLWAREIAAAHRRLGGAVPYALLDDFSRSRLAHLVGFTENWVVGRKVIDEVWPALKRAAGREIRERPDSKIAARVLALYGAYGDVARANVLLDEAWLSSDPAAPPQTASPRFAPAPPATRPWRVAATAGARDPNVPPIDGWVRELDLWPANTYLSHYPAMDPLVKHRKPRITTLRWHQGELWVGQAITGTATIALPIEGTNYLWRYDPAVQAIELVTQKLGRHSGIRGLVWHHQHCWLGLDADGVWQGSIDQPDARRFKAEDGLATPRILGAAAGERFLFFVGSANSGLVIPHYEFDGGRWFSSLLPPAQTGSDRPRAAVEEPRIAASGDWVGVLAPAPAGSGFYDVARRTWRELPAAAESGQPGPGSVYYSISADASGFWLGKQNGVVHFDPRMPDRVRSIPVPGVPTASAHDGQRLWLVLEDPTGAPRIALLDKDTGRYSGEMPIPVAGLRAMVGDRNADEHRIPLEQMRFAHLAAGGGRVWAGGPALFELVLRPDAPVVGPASPGDHTLHRAASRGDLAAVEGALAAKVDVNAPTTSGWTPLLAAVEGGHEAVIRALLRAGASPNHLSGNGRSPLEIAAARGEGKLVGILLEAGANPDLAAGLTVTGLPELSSPVEMPPPHVEATSPPAQPANVRAHLTRDGDVELTWQDRSDNESVFAISRRDGRSPTRRYLAHVAANTESWVDRELPDPGTEVGYTVEALNGASSPDRGDVAVRLTLPSVRPAHVHAHRPTRKALPPAVESKTPLMAAAQHGHLPVVQALLAAKATVDARDAVGQTALLLAARAGQREVARALLRAGAAADLSDGRGRTAAQAVYERHEDEGFWRETIASLPSDRRRRESSRLVHLAARDGQIHDLETLRGLDALIDAPNRFGHSALSLAIERRQSTAALWLIRHGFSLQRKYWRLGEPQSHAGPVIAALMRADLPEVLGALLDAGLSVNAMHEDMPLVAAAARSGQAPLVALLIERGADLNSRSGEGKLPVNYASTPAVQALLRPRTAGKWMVPTSLIALEKHWSSPITGENPARKAANARLFAACRHNDPAGATGAIADGAQLDVAYANRMTPLTLAFHARAYDVGRLLVEHGASVNRLMSGPHAPVLDRPDKIELTGQSSALGFAVEAGHVESVSFLLRAGADPNLWGHQATPPLVIAVRNRNIPLTEKLLDAGADPNFCGLGGRSALAEALVQGEAQLVDLLLARGANPRAQRVAFQVGRPEPIQLGASLLMSAAAGGKVELLKKMIGLGQDPKFVSTDGFDALASAAGSGHLAAVEFLMTLVERSPRAIPLARQKGHHQIVERLSRAGY